jgi:hypothetical protein
MGTEDDTVTGGDDTSLSIEQAASAYAKATTPETSNGQSASGDQEQNATADDDQQTSDEDEGEREGEPEDEGQAEDEEDAEPDSDQGRFVAANGKVRLPDGTVSTVSDLIQGNLKDRDYRQKTTDLAAQRRVIEERSQALAGVEASKQQVEQQREYLEALMQSITPQAPDPALMQTDPIGYMQAKDYFERFQQHQQYIQNQSAETRQQAEAKAKQDRDGLANAEMERLREALPVLKDETKLKAFAEDIKSAGAKAGFSPKELAESVPYDHRLALVLQKAAKWDRLQASKPKVQQQVQNRPPVQRAGQRPSPDARKAQQSSDAVNRLKQSGTVEDAAAAYLASRRG